MAIEGGGRTDGECERRGAQEERGGVRERGRGRREGGRGGRRRERWGEGGGERVRGRAISEPVRIEAWRR